MTDTSLPDTMSLPELIEAEKSLAAAVANATAVAKASKAAHKAAAERLARYKIGYSSIWRSFATRLQIEKQKRQKLLVNLHDIDIREDVIRGGIPRLLVEVDYTHPILSEIPNGTFGCGAPAEDNVYEDPYSAEGYPWEVEARVWNEFQAKYHNITAEESDRLISKRQRDIEEQKAEFDRLPKRRRDDDYDGCY